MAAIESASWKAIAGMRDELVHHYDAVDAEEVWKALRSLQLLLAGPKTPCRPHAGAS